MTEGLTYKDAGVDIDRGNALVEHIAPLAARTRRPEVLTGVGGFGALFKVPLDRYREPLLVSGTDGVGTKLRLALDHGQLSGVGIDLVAMCVNDILTAGAEPLFFLDYYATAELDLEQARAVLDGVAAGCEQAGAALIGGETAEMPGMYAKGDLDLAGFCVGIVDADQVVDGRKARPGDAVIALHANGLHSNGYSLVRRVLDLEGANAPATLDGDPLVQSLLKPTRIYVRSVRALLQQVRVTAMAHITGGGIPENLPRALPPGLSAAIERGAWPEQSVFRWLADAGRIERAEMDRTFNCGVGFVVCVPEAQVGSALAAFEAHATPASRIGTLVDDRDGPKVIYV
ncbi:MAG: phosphoribosylformylglycinamidine cyclo-ligase [Pseudomonadota bacterium]